MPKTKSSPCVLCDHEAQFEHHDGDRIRYYECPKCHFYAISERAVRYLEDNSNHPKIKSDLIAAVAELFSASHDQQIYEITYPPSTAADPSPYRQFGGLCLVKVSRTKYSQ